MKKFIASYVRCAEKLKKKDVRDVVVRPVLASDLNDRGQVDLMNYSSLPDSEYCYIMHYKEHLTKVLFLQSLT